MSSNRLLPGMPSDNQNGLSRNNEMIFDPANLQRSGWSDEAAILDTCRTEFDRVNTELNDLRLLIQQSTQEVEALNQRKVLVVARLREMEERLEHYSRQDISATYVEANEAEMRAFMISEQRDQWQAKAKTHERYRYFLEHILQSLPQIFVAPHSPSGGGYSLASILPTSQLTGSLAQPTVAVPTVSTPTVPVLGYHSPAQELFDPQTSSLPLSELTTEALPYLQETSLLSDLEKSLDPVAMGPQHLLSLPPTGSLSAQTGSLPAQTGAMPAHLQEQSILARVIQAQENVRQKLAQRLHDGPAQDLANVVLEAEICAKLMKSSPQRVVGELEQLKHLVNVTLQETRKFIFELHPMTLADLGLTATIRRYADEIATRYGVQVPVILPQVEPFIPMGKRVAIFRVAQEAVTNAVEHGRATLIRVSMGLSPGGLVLEIEDAGAGFDVEQVQRLAHARKGLGLINMQERADVLGGTLRVESAPQRGTRVELKIPL
jgi:signal transduction histidine kinase